MPRCQHERYQENCQTNGKGAWKCNELKNLTIELISTLKFCLQCRGLKSSKYKLQRISGREAKRYAREIMTIIYGGEPESEPEPEGEPEPGSSFRRNSWKANRGARGGYGKQYDSSESNENMSDQVAKIQEMMSQHFSQVSYV